MSPRGLEILKRLDGDADFAATMARLRIARRSVPAPRNPLLGRVVAGLSAAPSQNDLVTPVSGRLVRSGKANLNGQLFDEQDLRYGLSSLREAPLTWNHWDARGAYGLIREAKLATSDEHGTHIGILGDCWTSRFPSFAAQLIESIKDGSASLSMECIASSVKCLASGCGCEVESLEGACTHLRKGGEVRRLVNPTFYGAGLILGGTSPGWPEASLEIVGR